MAVVSLGLGGAGGGTGPGAVNVACDFCSYSTLLGHTSNMLHVQCMY